MSALHPVAELEAKLQGRGIRATELLAKHSVPIIDGFYSAPALATAMKVSVGEVPRGEDVDPVAVARSVLGRGGIEIASAQKRHGWHLLLRASGAPRKVFNEDLKHLWDGEPRLGPVEVGPEPIAARIYFVQRRHNGSANFVCSGVESASPPPLNFFVLLQESRIWVSSSGVLAWLAEDARKTPHEHKIENVRLSPSRDPGGQIRCWFPLGHSSFDIEVQVHDAHDQTVLPVPRVR